MSVNFNTTKKGTYSFLFLILFSLLFSSVSEARTFYVDDDAGEEGDGSESAPFKRIQDAVDEAEDGDKIFVHTGSYRESVFINKSLEIEGEKAEKSILEPGEGWGFVISGKGVVLKNFKIQNFSKGILLQGGSEDVRFEKVFIFNNTVGVLLNSTRNITIKNSVISLNKEGVKVQEGCENLRIVLCVISSNTLYGINLTTDAEAEIEASHNYWGEPTGPYHAELNPKGEGNRVSDGVIFRPWYEDREMSSLRFLNEKEAQEKDRSFILFFIFAFLLTFFLLAFVVWLPEPYCRKIRKWFVKTFELESLSERDRYIIHFSLYFLGLIVVVFVVDLAAVSLYENSTSLYPLQRIETVLIGEIQQHLLGIDVYYRDITLYYNENQEFLGYTLSQREKIGGVSFKITATCSGFHETVFLSVLILGFYGVELKKKLKWAGIFAVVIFIENLIRIIILFPYYLIYGRDKGEMLHYYWWNYYQYVFIMTLFMLWFYFVAWKDVDRKLEELEKKEKNKASI